ncbi:MAG: hypothetical protein HW421_589 [Ignavibacteria bacterium]|nr:hypothetical protein [Ignavibacteria bacterium]
MKFLVDECIGPSVAGWMKNLGYDVVSVYDSYRGAKDNVLLEIANNEQRVLITNDKGFGKLVFAELLPHSGVILLRLKDETPQNKIKVIKSLLEKLPSDISKQFLIVTETSIRIVHL